METTIKPDLKEEELQEQIDVLREKYGRNKRIPRSYELSILTALSYYPQLADTPLYFRLVRGDHFPYCSRPDWRTMFRGKHRRKYLITLSVKHKKSTEPMLFQNLDFNCQVGVMGHELAHTADYIRMNSWQLLKLGITYYMPAIRKKIERATDFSTIVHGLGWQLYEFASYIRDAEETLSKNKWIEKYYLSPEEILGQINCLNSYSIQSAENKQKEEEL